MSNRANIRTLVVGIVCLSSGWIANDLLFYNQYKGAQTRFSDAAANGSTGEMARLLSNGAKIDALPFDFEAESKQLPALYSAISNGKLSSVQWLLEHGASADLPFMAESPLSIAEIHLNDAQAIVNILRTYKRREHDH
jgi:hypothetical protein